MIDLARANDIAVVLAGIPPSRRAVLARRPRPRPLIRELNGWLRGWLSTTATCSSTTATVLADAEGGLRADLGNDGVHPNRVGYARMRPEPKARSRRRWSSGDRRRRRTPEHGTPRRAVREIVTSATAAARSAALGQRPLTSADAPADIALLERATTLALWPSAPPGGTFVPVTLPAVARAVRRERRDARAPRFRAATPERPSRARDTRRRLHVRVRARTKARTSRRSSIGARYTAVRARVSAAGRKAGSTGEDVPLQDAPAVRCARSAPTPRAGHRSANAEPSSASRQADTRQPRSRPISQSPYMHPSMRQIRERPTVRDGLVYPVVTMALPGTHAVSRELLLGPHPVADTDRPSLGASCMSVRKRRRCSSCTRSTRRRCP